MKDEICSYRNHETVEPAAKCPECDVYGVRYRIADYFKRPRNGTTDMMLCGEHAGWWNETHPFGPVAEPVGVKQWSDRE